MRRSGRHADCAWSPPDADAVSGDCQYRAGCSNPPVSLIPFRFDPTFEKAIAQMFNYAKDKRDIPEKGEKDKYIIQNPP